MGPDWCKRWGSNPLAPQSPGFTDRCHTFTAALAKMAEETGVEPACAGISDTDWFSGPASHRGTPLPFWRRVRDLNSRHLAVLLVSSEVVQAAHPTLQFWCGWGDSNSQSAGSKPAAFAILATPARLNLSNSSPGRAASAARLGKTKPAHFERVGVLRIILWLRLIENTPTRTRIIE